MYRKALFLALLLILPVDCKKIGGGGRGGGSGRHSSGSSGRYPQQQQSGQYGGSYPHQTYQNYPNQQGGYRPPNQGGYQQPHSGGYNQGGYHQPNAGYNPGYHANQPVYQKGFHSGSGPGSASRGSQWKTALAAGAVGAVGGIIAYEAGKAIIKSAMEPAHIQGRNYYFNNDDHRYQSKPGELMCSMPLETLIKQTQPATAAPVTAAPTNDTGSLIADITTTPSPDQLLSTMQFKDGSRPKTVTWPCRAGTEVCCGTECCPAPPPQQRGSPNGGSYSNTKMSLTNIILIVLLALLLLTCCCCFVLYACFRSLFDTMCPIFKGDNNSPYNDQSKYLDTQPQGFASYQSQPSQQQNAMPMQAYPGSQQYQSGYPAAPGYVYPSQPTPYQYSS